MILHGTVGSNFDIFAASGESTAWVLLWKTRSRPIRVRGCPVAKFGFSAPHLIRERGQWLCSGKKKSGRQLQLITLENERGDDTDYPSSPIFFHDPDALLGPGGTPEPPAP